MSEVSLNTNVQPKKETHIEAVETGGVIASNTNTPTITAGGTISWKIENAITPDSYDGIGRFAATGRFEVEGNIMSLVSGRQFTGSTSVGSYQFIKLFYNISGLTSAENLVLPATTLRRECYEDMFMDCINLIKAPKILPATTLKYQCYRGMFEYCSGLTTTPELPATTLASECYAAMFADCKNLTAAPVLPATILVDYCYVEMFEGCRKLKSVTCYATDMGYYSTYSWLNNVSSSGTFTKPLGISWERSASGIPRGWTIVNV